MALGRRNARIEPNPVILNVHAVATLAADHFNPDVVGMCVPMDIHQRLLHDAEDLMGLPAADLLAHRQPNGHLYLQIAQPVEMGQVVGQGADQPSSDPRTAPEIRDQAANLAKGAIQHPADIGQALLHSRRRVAVEVLLQIKEEQLQAEQVLREPVVDLLRQLRPLPPERLLMQGHHLGGQGDRIGYPVQPVQLGITVLALLTAGHHQYAEHLCGAADGHPHRSPQPFGQEDRVGGWICGQVLGKPEGLQRQLIQHDPAGKALAGPQPDAGHIWVLAAAGHLPADLLQRVVVKGQSGQVAGEHLPQAVQYPLKAGAQQDRFGVVRSQVKQGHEAVLPSPADGRCCDNQRTITEVARQDSLGSLPAQGLAQRAGFARAVGAVQRLTALTSHQFLLRYAQQGCAGWRGRHHPQVPVKQQNGFCLHTERHLPLKGVLVLLELFFSVNRVVIYFAYGLVFFIMGFAVALGAVTFRGSRLAVARSLPWLAGFGLLLGLAEWGVVFIPLQAAFFPAALLNGLYLLHAALLIAAHGCLLVFGARLVAEWEPVRLILPAGIALGTVAASAVLVLPGAAIDWQMAARTLAAYGLGLPGAVLSAYGLLLQRRDLAPFYPRSARSLQVAAWAFILSVPLGPLAVPLAGAGAVRFWGIPLELPLTVGGLVLAWSLIAGLEALRVEHARRLERAERREAMLEERYRLSKSLNDGVIQDLFAAGMLIGASAYDLPPEQRAGLKAVEQQLQSTVDRLRSYLMDLDPIDWNDPNLAAGLRKLVDDFRANTLIPVVTQLESEVVPVPSEIRRIYTVVYEALSNVRRHAGATQVTLTLRSEGNALLLEIMDNGRGIGSEPVHGAGLDRMCRAAELVGGTLSVGRAPGGGTRIALSLPVVTNASTRESSTA